MKVFICELVYTLQSGTEIFLIEKLISQVLTFMSGFLLLTFRALVLYDLFLVHALLAFCFVPELPKQ